MAGPPIPEAEELDCRVPSGAIVIGPKELPRVMLQVGQTAAKVRRMAAEFRSQFMDAMREAEIDDIKSDVERLTESAKADTGMNPLVQITADLTQAIDSAEKPAMPPSASTPTLVSRLSRARPLVERHGTGNTSRICADRRG
jgi:sec-independent protein translocase protein TatB